MNSKRVVVTGGAGFIGSALVRRLIQDRHDVLNIDKLTYAANLANLKAIDNVATYRFAQIDICDKDAVDEAINSFKPDLVMHLAAESHVDNSIRSARPFVDANVVGTVNLLNSVQEYTERSENADVRFVHVSTDEVYGDLEPDNPPFNEQSRYKPSSPYSASKAASDHFARAWHRTYGLPVIVTNCSNNYGPYQFPEKLIPHMILQALKDKPLPVYGTGENVRDWLHVDDHVDALVEIAERGTIGETYLIGTENEWTNIDIVKKICEILDDLRPRSNKESYRDLITFVEDRKGHDTRYSIDPSFLRESLNWSTSRKFEDGLSETVSWYLQNEEWWAPLLERHAPS
ncbi:MAG: dTDP-glucose 4,6-dehydratase [Pseudomonadota bacterium]